MRARTLLPSLVGCLLLAAPAGAWPEALMHSLERDARRLLPASLNRLLGEREAQIFEALRRFPPELSQSLGRDLSRGRLDARTLGDVQAELDEALSLMRSRRVGEGLVRLGAALRVPADLSDPVLAIGPRGYPAGVTREYYAFVSRNLEKIPVVLDDRAALGLRPQDLPGYWQRLLERSREQSAVIRIELYRGGRVVDQRGLDYRSPVFGVGSLAYSRAVNAIAATWLAVWREAKGDTTRVPSPTLILPRPDGPAAFTRSQEPIGARP
jgi:hypothetical protein